MNTHLLPGLSKECSNVEIFSADGELKAFVAGNIYHWSYFPGWLVSILEEDYKVNPEVDRLLAKRAVPVADRLRLHVHCKFGGLNHTPDITECGQVHGEHWNCQCADCPLEPLYRAKLAVAHGALTQRELEIIKLLAAERSGKMICDELEITESTLNTHKRNIFDKTGFPTTPGVVAWATREGLV